MLKFLCIRVVIGALINHIFSIPDEHIFGQNKDGEEKHFHGSLKVLCCDLFLKQYEWLLHSF